MLTTVDVNREMLDKLSGELLNKSTKAMKKTLNIFSFCFNEKKIKGDVVFTINDPSLLNDIATLFLVDAVKVLVPLINNKAYRSIALTYAKNTLVYLRNLINPAMEAFTIRTLGESLPLFQLKPLLYLSLLKTLADKWANSNDIPVKFHAFRQLRAVVERDDATAKKVLNVMFKLFFKRSSEFRFDTFD